MKQVRCMYFARFQSACKRNVPQASMRPAWLVHNYLSRRSFHNTHALHCCTTALRSPLTKDTTIEMERLRHTAAAASSNASKAETSCSRQPDGRLEKSGPRVRVKEFEALKHARRLGPPVPTVHEFLPEEQTISLDFVEGDTLESVWPTLSESEWNQSLGSFDISSLRCARVDK
jgi:hypothetical protein